MKPSAASTRALPPALLPTHSRLFPAMYTANEKLSSANITEIMQTAYIDYSMSVIISRALPDARDGLKPVQRRILYAMLREGLLHNRAFDKCAGVVGEVLEQLPPARRLLGLRHPRAPGPVLGHALPAHRSPGQLRLRRRRSARRPTATPSAASTRLAEELLARHRRGHRRLRAQLQGVDHRADRPARRPARTC